MIAFERRLLGATVLLVVAPILAAGQSPPDQAAAVAPLPAAEATPFLGFWTATVDLQGQQVDIGLDFADHDGELRAVVHSPLGEQPIDTIERLGDGLRLITQSSFGPLEIEVAVEEDRLDGVFRAAAGQISTEFTGIRGDQSTEEERLQRIGRALGRRPSTSLDADGRRVRVEYPDPPIGGDEHSRLAALGAGEVLEFSDAPALKLRTDWSLRFGEVRIAAGNAAPGYPGVYSLWLKRSADGWRLVFNEAADVWGSQHFSEFDVAEIPLSRATAGEPTERLTVGLVEVGKGGRLELIWGDDRFSADFAIER